MRHSLVILATVAGLVAAPSIALADQEHETRSISVTGQGVVVATPDIAEIGAGVVSIASSAAEALADNSIRMTAVFEGLKALGVTAREMRTSDFSVSPVYSRQSNDNSQPPSITGPRARDPDGRGCGSKTRSGVADQRECCCRAAACVCDEGDGRVL